LEEKVIGKPSGHIKWIDFMSSDYLLIDNVILTGKEEKWIRFNIAPFLYFEPWNWYILAETHNEIHGLKLDNVNEYINDYQQRGWSIIDKNYYLAKWARQ
jgi:hypothetical protein